MPWLEDIRGRQLVLEIATSGLDPRTDRVLEIACLQLEDGRPGARQFHRLLDPGVEVTSAAWRIHGHSATGLRSCPRFAEVAVDFLEFIAFDDLIIHHAEFDLHFLNAELARLGSSDLRRRHHVIDTIWVARGDQQEKIPFGVLCREAGVEPLAPGQRNALAQAHRQAEVYALLKAAENHREAGVEPLAPGQRNAPAQAHRQAEVHALLKAAENHREAEVEPLAPGQRNAPAQARGQAEVHALLKAAENHRVPSGPEPVSGGRRKAQGNAKLLPDSSGPQILPVQKKGLRLAMSGLMLVSAAVTLVLSTMLLVQAVQLWWA